MKKMETTKTAKKNLPADWRWVRLGDVCQINPRRGNINRSDNIPTSFVPMEAIDAEKGVICGMRERLFSEVKKGYTFFEEGDVLFAKITPCMQNGKHVIARGLNGGVGFASTEFHVIRPTNEILSEWIHYFVRQPIVLHEATNHFTGAVGQQRVPGDFLKSLEISLPPLSEQRRVAGVLREQMAAVEKARAAAQARLAAVKDLPASFLRQVFPQPGQPLPDGWRWARLGEVCRVFAGSAAPQGKDYFSSAGPFFFRVSDIGRFGRTMQLLESQDRLSPMALARCQLVLARKGAVLFPKSGAAITTNNRALLDVDGYIVSHLMALEPKDAIISEWVYHATCRIDMMDFSDNTGYPSLKQSVVDKIQIPLPPLAEQRRIAGVLREQMAAMEKTRAAAEEELKTINVLPAGLVRRAFNGEI